MFYLKSINFSWKTFLATYNQHLRLCSCKNLSVSIHIYKYFQFKLSITNFDIYLCYLSLKFHPTIIASIETNIGGIMGIQLLFPPFLIP